MVLKCIIQFRYVTEAFSLHSDIARCLPPTPGSCTDSEENRTRTCSGAGYVVTPYTVSHAIHAHESCMHACSGEGSALQFIHYLLLAEGQKQYHDLVELATWLTSRYSHPCIYFAVVTVKYA